MVRRLRSAGSMTTGLAPLAAICPMSLIVKTTAVRLKTEQIQLAADFVVFECGRGYRKCLGHRHFLEEGDRENLQQSVEGGGLQGKALLDDGNQDIDGNRDPDLRLHRVVGR